MFSSEVVSFIPSPDLFMDITKVADFIFYFHNDVPVA